MGQSLSRPKVYPKAVAAVSSLSTRAGVRSTAAALQSLPRRTLAKEPVAVSERPCLVRRTTGGPGKTPRFEYEKPFGEPSHAEVSVHLPPFHRSRIPAVARGTASPGGSMVRLDAE